MFRANASTSVYYRRGSWAIQIPVTIGRSQFEDTGGDGSLIRYESRDYLITPSDLVIDGIQVEPASGDQIIEGALDNGLLFEVLSIPGEGFWRWSDQFRTTYRVHAKFASAIP